MAIYQTTNKEKETSQGLPIYREAKAMGVRRFGAAHTVVEGNSPNLWAEHRSGSARRWAGTQWEIISEEAIDDEALPAGRQPAGGAALMTDRTLNERNSSQQRQATRRHSRTARKGQDKLLGSCLMRKPAHICFAGKFRVWLLHCFFFW